VIWKIANLKIVFQDQDLEEVRDGHDNRCEDKVQRTHSITLVDVGQRLT